MNVQPAQDLPEFGTWLNAAPSTLMEHRGRPVVLAFVNAASAWCAQRLAELALWQARNPGKLQLVIVQVPRFDFERQPQQALKLLRRAGATAPILLDADWQTWRRFKVEAWPTLVLIDAQGRERDRLVGLGGELDRALHSLCDGLSAPLEDDIRGGAEMNAEPRLPLRFPTGLAATADRLYVSDTGHHRVLECTHGGRILRQFGLGTADMVNGSASEATFNRPRGLALGRDVLYVADTGNHSLRRINLLSGHVDTLCGTGRPGAPVEGQLSQPWDSPLHYPLGVAVAENQLLVATAGDNRIWSYDLGNHKLSWRAGAGGIEVRDGSGHLAAFAQPSAVVAVQQVLYVCDALGSAVRSMQLRGDLVQTLLGQGPWEFGNHDGPRSQARLQFPQAIAHSADAPVLWIADAGNGLLRTLRLGGGELSTVQLPRRLHSPAGLAVAAGKVFIAETDGHAVLCYDPNSGELGEVPIEE